MTADDVHARFGDYVAHYNLLEAQL